MAVLAKLAAMNMLRANTPEDKREVMERLYNAWMDVPDLRLGQLICGVFGTRLESVFYFEDFLLIKQIESFVLEHKLQSLLK